ncbi:energy transducer TonB [Myxococcus stipitatus]|uniref:energy transducer TonB family protein n=1 Tax=Myxococcus stipitatus TaxID=83455 RepID=UPI001F2C98AB|nr:energy transducer TonB [Myxococcus stipitatus]MCE9667593.1 energy transducer TonB [Myxococcus stipitatus]
MARTPSGLASAAWVLTPGPGTVAVERAHPDTADGTGARGPEDAGTPHARPGTLAAVSGGGISRRVEGPTPQRLVEDLVSESIGRGKVDRGLVHPYFSELGKRLLATWDADRSVKEHGLQGYFDMGLERSRAFAQVWSERAAHYGASGAFGARNAPEDDRRRPTSASGNADLRMNRELREKMREEFRATRRALIRVVQDRQGRLLDVALVAPSHQPEVDREAVKDVRAAAERLPAPPPEAVGGQERITSLWQFELILSISPPIPTFTFEFDEALGFVDTRLPLDKRIYKRVRLVELR